MATNNKVDEKGPPSYQINLYLSIDLKNYLLSVYIESTQNYLNEITV
jgi:hypothetical protein